MRDPKLAQNDRAKRSQRKWLVAIILAASPCLAQEPQDGGLGVLPPLPLNADTVPPAVRNNPYITSETGLPKAARSGPSGIRIRDNH